MALERDRAEIVGDRGIGTELGRNRPVPLVGFTDAAHDEDGRLARQPKALAEVAVGDLLEPDLVRAPMLEGNTRQPVCRLR